MQFAHKVDAVEMRDYAASTWVIAASSTTVDGTQRKRLEFNGKGKWRVTRKYLKYIDEDYAEVAFGPATECVRIYNGMD